MSMLWKKLSSAQIIILGFAALILLGSLLLMMPFSTKDGMGAAFDDALFTATSAVCVTGLVVQDTASYWSAAGQAILLALIQIGGMGVVTVAVAIAAASGRTIGLRQRSTMQESISAPQVGGIVRITGFILCWTFALEMAGAALLAPVFCREFGVLQGLWYSVFHSVSAFCNAGFDLMGVKAQYASLTHYSAHAPVNLVIMFLIVSGGLGFMTWDDIRRNRLHVHRYRMQSKVILLTTLALIALPAVYLYFFEFADMPQGERIWSSLFQSVTTRTAGFNTVDLTQMSEAGQFVMILLMLVGGSPGSTAGGMKTTTLAVAVSTAAAVFARRQHTQFFGRRIEDDTVRSAFTILTMYMTLFLIGGMVISRLEGISMMVALFETASAIGTVGLTLGVTPGLGAVSRLILIFLMYFGRVGGLTLIFAALPGRNPAASRLPKERLTVG